MAKTELMVLFKRMQRDDKKDVLKFEYRGNDDDEKIKVPQSIYEMVGEMVNIEVEGAKSGPITAELQKANKDSKKVVLDLALRGDSEEKALDLYRKAGQNVKLFIEPSQSSLIEEEKPKNDHAGIEYAVDVTTGNVLSYNERKKKEQEAAAAEPVEAEKEEVDLSETNDDEFGDDLEDDDLKPVDDDELPF
ncbi:hypothetical protein [Bacillus sp. FJAT-45037]|uniref:hypothetical protein n=1 Tax=Bacillus sp. FJAT-45037 TaxID=2011007 RepID=UPI000C23357A|nr:hypothetical protein [Bacillus sp. FJAT-45037]